MPRQIIDTQTGRPGYLRRRAIQATAAVLLLALIATLVFLFLTRHGAVASSLPLSVAKTGQAFQETRRVRAEPGSPSHPRRSHAA